MCEKELRVYNQDQSQVIEAPSAANRIPAIQGLRAIAVLLVVAFHSGLNVPGGFLGWIYSS